MSLDEGKVYLAHVTGGDLRTTRHVSCKVLFVAVGGALDVYRVDFIARQDN